MDIFKKLMESEMDARKEKLINRIAHKFNGARHDIEKRVLQSIGRIMELNLLHDEAQDRFFKGISAVTDSIELANLLENLLDSDTMEKVAKSDSVVEYDDGRMALVWIPDFATSKKVGSHDWPMSAEDGEDFWAEQAEGLHKCYMIIDRTLPASHARHLFAFYIGPDGDVTDGHDQHGYFINADTDKAFKEALKATGARPYNREDVRRTDDDLIVEDYISHHRDIEMLSKRVLTAEYPVSELGRLYEALQACAEENLIYCRRLMLVAAMECEKRGATAVVSERFVNCLYEERTDLFCRELKEEIVATLVAMMPSIDVAKKLCTAGVIELAKDIEEKNQIFEMSIRFGNRTMVASLIKESWVRPYDLGTAELNPEKLLALGEKTNRLLLDSGFQTTGADTSMPGLEG